MHVARIVLALEEHDVAEEVMHFLDRGGRTRVVATAGDDRQLAEAVRQLEPDAVIAQPALVTSGTLNGGALIAVETRESVEGLRAAIRAGARAYFVWPAEREALAAAAAATAARADLGVKRATVVAVYGPRGGSGTTFVATHLAAAFARRTLETVLIDADPVFADVTSALGVFAGDGTEVRDDTGADAAGPRRTMSDAITMLDELDPVQLREFLWVHPEGGFSALLAPEPLEAARVGPTELVRLLDVAARGADVVVMHLPRALDGLALAGIEGADRVLFLLSLDVASFRCATRAVALLPGVEIDFVVNRASRAEVTPSDVARVFGREPIAVLPADGGVARAQDHGRLMPARSRMGRAFDRLAAQLHEGERESS